MTWNVGGLILQGGCGLLHELGQVPHHAGTTGLREGQDKDQASIRIMISQNLVYLAKLHQDLGSRLYLLGNKALETLGT